MSILPLFTRTHSTAFCSKSLCSPWSSLVAEFRALESVLLSVLSALEAEMVFIRNLVGGLLAELEDDIDHDRFRRLLHYSRRLASFQSRAKLVRLQIFLTAVTRVS